MLNQLSLNSQTNTIKKAVLEAIDKGIPLGRAIFPLVSSLAEYWYEEGKNSNVKIQKHWVRPEELNDYFSEIRVVYCGYELSQDEVSRLSGCVGYALRQVIRGENLSEPVIHTNGSFITKLDYYYDATKTASDDPDFVECFELAKKYIVEGTPIRKTDRAGRGTKGTRLVEGIGGDYNNISIFVR